RKLAEAPADDRVWSFPHSVAFLGEWQFYAGYCVLVSRSCVRELSELPEAERRAFLDEMCLLARAIETSHRPHKVNYELLGNQVAHPHWHLFPRYASDPHCLKPVWVDLDTAEAGEQQRLRTGPASRAATAALVREALTRLGAPRA